MSQWIEFLELVPKAKTKVFSVHSKVFGCEIGTVKWHPAWRKYCYIPITEGTSIYDMDCLMTIANFLKDLNHKHKMERKK